MIDISKNIVCFFDGCCEPKNPGGNMGMGAVIFQNGKELCSYSDFIPADGSNSNNVAEYLSFKWLVESLLELRLNTEPITVYGDSKMVICQMRGEWKIKQGMYVQYATKSKILLYSFKNISLKWIPRLQNTYADELSKNHLIKKGVEFKIQPV